MKNMKFYLVVFAVFLLPGLIFGEEEWPPKGKGVAISMVFGPEGIGGGVGYVWHDVGGKQGRFLQIYDVITNTAFQQYMVDYVEPSLFLDRDKLAARVLYVNRTGSHFFGLGADTEMEDAACYGKEVYIGRLGYTLPLPANMGITLSGIYNRTDLRDMDLDDPEFNEEYPELDEAISDVYPELYESEMFNEKPMTHGVSLSLFHDNQQGRHKVFPTKGGYEKITALRVEESLGADWNYWRYTAEVAHFFPLIGLTGFDRDPFNILAVYARWDRIDGDPEEVPFWAYPSLGHCKISIADYLDEVGLRGYWENRYADQNRAIASIEIRHRVKANWYPKYEEPENKMLADMLGSLKNFVKNTSWVFLYDAGQVWNDEDEDTEDIRSAAGMGWVFYFDPGHNMRVTISSSDEMSGYILFAYNQVF